MDDFILLVTHPDEFKWKDLDVVLSYNYLGKPGERSKVGEDIPADFVVPHFDGEADDVVLKETLRFALDGRGI